jgi:hypothetical protein
MGSLFELTFVEIPELTSSTGKTVLSVAVSDFYSLPDDLDEVSGYRIEEKSSAFLTKHGQETAKFLILKELQRYVPFKLGGYWRDPDSDIDWDKSLFRSNREHLLFLNEVGSRQWCPKVCYPEISNLFFAGDFCQNPITIATVEAAVVSGLQAAREVGRNEKIGKPIEIIEPDSYPETLMAVWKVALAPYAFGAKYWSASYDSLNEVTRAAGSGVSGGVLGSAASLVVESAMKASAVGIEWCNAMRSILNWR